MSRITTKVSVINRSARLSGMADTYTCSGFNANGLSDHAQASQGKNLQVQTGVQGRPRPRLVKLSVVQCCSGSSLQLRASR